MMVTLLVGFAEFQRDLVSERTPSGLARAKSAGKKHGRPQGRTYRTSTRKPCWPPWLKVNHTDRSPEIYRAAKIRSRAASRERRKLVCTSCYAAALRGCDGSLRRGASHRTFLS